MHSSLSRTTQRGTLDDTFLSKQRKIGYQVKASLMNMKPQKSTENEHKTIVAMTL